MHYYQINHTVIRKIDNYILPSRLNDICGGGGGGRIL